MGNINLKQRFYSMMEKHILCCLGFKDRKATSTEPVEKSETPTEQDTKETSPTPPPSPVGILVISLRGEIVKTSDGTLQTTDAGLESERPLCFPPTV
jgi:hypothetical protein